MSGYDQPGRCPGCGGPIDENGRAPDEANETSDSAALDAIAQLLDGTEWKPETFEDLAQWVRTTGRPVRDPSEVEDEPEET